MTEAFHESGTEDLLLVVLTDDKGLGPADEATYRKLVDALREDTRDVVMLQDFISTPPLRSIVTSKDNKAWVLPVGVAGELGTPRSYAAFNQISDIVKHTVAGTPLTANLTGPAATVADLTVAGERDRLPIELAIGVLVLIVLLMVYRSAVTMLLPLIAIGLSLVIAQSVVAGYSQLTGTGVSNQSIVFLSAIMAGAGTDYAVFLDQPLSRLSAAGRGFRSGGQAGVDLDRKSDHRIRHHRGNHLPPDQLRPDGGVQNGR